MKLITFTESARTRIGVLLEDGVLDLSQAAPGLPSRLTDFLAGGQAALAAAGKVLDTGSHYDLDAVRIEPPISRPGKILAVGLNYRAHAEESGSGIPEYPLIFTKQATSVTGPFDDVHLPPETRLLDYEGELGIVIGRRCRRVPRERALEVIAGFCVVNDVSVRDWQMRGSPAQFTMGKSWDTHCPFGPAIVTPEEVDPHALRLRTLVNGEVRQDSSTADLIFNCFEIIEYLSTAFTLEPGDLIPTGTPSGVGMAMKPPRALGVDDVVRVEIEGLGFIENRIVAEPDTAIW